MAVSTTSVGSYRELVRSGNATNQQFLIINAMQQGVSYSRREIARMTGLEINAVCGRVDELIKAGAVVECPARLDPVTRRRVQTVELNTGEKQRELF